MSAREAGITLPEVTTYIRYFCPGAFFPEESAWLSADRDPQRAASAAISGAFAFEFFDRVSATATIDGAEVVLRSDAINKTGRYYIDAEPLTAADVEALPGDHRILLANMRGNGWETILRCRTGNFQPLEDGDVLVSTKGGA